MNLSGRGGIGVLFQIWLGSLYILKSETTWSTTDKPCEGGRIKGNSRLLIWAIERGELATTEMESTVDGTYFRETFQF